MPYEEKDKENHYKAGDLLEEVKLFQLGQPLALTKVPEKNTFQEREQLDQNLRKGRVTFGKQPAGT